VIIARRRLSRESSESEDGGVQVPALPVDTKARKNRENSTQREKCGIYVVVDGQVVTCVEMLCLDTKYANFCGMIPCGGSLVPGRRVI
jgi:hypothetical protein